MQSFFAVFSDKEGSIKSKEGRNNCIDRDVVHSPYMFSSSNGTDIGKYMGCKRFLNDVLTGNPLRVLRIADD